MEQNRRTFIKSLGALTGTAILNNYSQASSITAADRQLHIASNQYPWGTFYKREGKDWEKNLSSGLQELAQTGIKGYEPLVTSPEQLKNLQPLLQKNKLEMRSIYVNSKLHEQEEAKKSMDEVLAIADEAKRQGVKIMVTNPSPVRWGGPEDKSDAQIEFQAITLDQLGAELRKKDITLAYHNHDPEMRQSAREFHHMMLGTDPLNVSFCLDAHWVFRGSGDSQVALFDIVKLYGPRISELHLRQSKNGIWTETFGPGDIDYKRLVDYLVKEGLRPHLVLEQAVEEKSPYTMNSAKAHRESMKYASQIFAPLAS